MPRGRWPGAEIAAGATVQRVNRVGALVGILGGVAIVTDLRKPVPDAAKIARPDAAKIPRRLLRCGPVVIGWG